jgi:hypothetical protein
MAPKQFLDIIKIMDRMIIFYIYTGGITLMDKILRYFSSFNWKVQSYFILFD